MKAFRRRFSVESIGAASGNAPIVRALFEQWQLPGGDAEPTKLGLRLAVRDGYLNFYAMGQSVAKLSLVGSKPRIDVHNAYVQGSGSGYCTFRGAELNALTENDLASWTSAALLRAGEEKRFVDELIGANPGTLDIEMGLPGDPRARHPVTNKMTAPRMDLVVLQETTAGPQLAFWEAKCGDNSEIRARGEPHVVSQLRNYVRWLRLPELVADEHPIVASRRNEVLSAYLRTAAILCSLASICQKRHSTALEIWAQARESKLTAITQPGVVIANYGSDTHGQAELEERNATLRRNARTFHDNAHLLRLESTIIEQAILVHQYDVRPTGPLPILSGHNLEIPNPDA